MDRAYNAMIFKLTKRMSSFLIGAMLIVSGCTNPDTIVDKSTILGNDYRLWQQTPAWELAKAVKNNDLEDIKSLSKQDARLVNYQEPVYGQTLLQLAVYNEQYETAKSLLDNGADPNLADKNYASTPLMEAANIGSGTYHSDARFIKLLLERGADPNIVQHGGKRKTRDNALLVACTRGNIEYISLLIAAGSKSNFTNEYGDSPLHRAALAVSLNGDPEIVSFLISKGADVHAVMYVTKPEGVKKYLTDELRYWRFEIGSKQHQKKMEIVKYLQQQGMDYWKTPIPEEYIPDESADYLKHY